MAIHPRASLLGLPKELRLHIYDWVLHEEINCTTFHGFEKRHTVGQGFGSKPRANPDARLSLSWFILPMICKQISAEFKSYVETAQNRVYIAEATPNRRGVGTLTWRKISCAPTHVDTMILNYNFQPGKHGRFGGDGGPMPIVRELFQTLNIFLHCGPRMDFRHKLSKPMHIATLVVNICYPPRLGPKLVLDTSGKERRNPFGGDPYRELWQFVRTVCTGGIVYGLVDEIGVTDAIESQFAEVENHGAWTMPNAWERYGFRWGLQQFYEEEVQE